MKNILILLTVLLCLSCTDKQTDTTDQLPRSTPEKEGVDSQGIINFLETTKEQQHQLHSLMVLRRGNVIAEGWADPFAPDLNHTLYSVTKTFTSTAVGFAVSENLLSVNEKVIKFFPELLPDTVSPYLEALTVKNILTMSTGQHADSPFSLTSADNVKNFLAFPIDNEPGSVFRYNSAASHILSAIVQKLTGQKIHDYLQPRLFQPLGIKDLDWMEDAAGINIGGWGLSAKTEDLAKLGQLYLQKGKWNDKQLLPEKWIEEATSPHILQSPDLPAELRATDNWAQGYGYQLWKSVHGFRADGAYGQYIVVLPEQDMVVAITSNINNMGEVLATLFDCLLPAVQDKPLAENPENNEKIKELIKKFDIPVPGGITQSPTENKISGNQYIFNPEETGFNTLTINFDKDIFKLDVLSDSFKENSEFGRGFWAKSGSYYWDDDKTLVLTMMSTEGGNGGNGVFTLKFDEETLHIAYGEQSAVGILAG